MCRKNACPLHHHPLFAQQHIASVVDTSYMEPKSPVLNSTATKTHHAEEPSAPGQNSHITFITFTLDTEWHRRFI